MAEARSGSHISDRLENLTTKVPGSEFKNLRAVMKSAAVLIRQLEAKIEQLEESGFDDYDERDLEGFVSTSSNYVQKIEKGTTPGIVSVRKVRFK